LRSTITGGDVVVAGASLERELPGGMKSWWGLVQTRREIVTGRLGARSGAARKGYGLSGE